MVTIGKILKPFGVKGEVRVASLTDVPDRFDRLEHVALALANGQVVETEILSVRQVREGYILGFSAFSDPEEAARYRGAFIQVPEEPHLPRSDGTYYHFELIGLRVEDQQGQRLGVVEDILDYPHQQVFVIKQEEKEWLLPARKQMIESVDLPNKILRLASKEFWDLSNAL